MVKAGFTASKVPRAYFECKLEAISCHLALIDGKEVGKFPNLGSSRKRIEQASLFSLVNYPSFRSFVSGIWCI